MQLKKYLKPTYKYKIKAKKVLINNYKLNTFNRHERELKIYYFFKKYKLRKREYNLAPAILPFWASLVQKSKWPTRKARMTSLGAVKLWVLTKLSGEDFSLYATSELTTINTLKYSMIKIIVAANKPLGKLSLSLGHDHFTSSNKMHNPWFTTTFNSKLNTTELILVDPALQRIHKINIASISVIKLLINGPAKLHEPKLFKTVPLPEVSEVFMNIYLKNSRDPNVTSLLKNKKSRSWIAKHIAKIKKQLNLAYYLCKNTRLSNLKLTKIQRQKSRLFELLKKPAGVHILKNLYQLRAKLIFTKSKSKQTYRPLNWIFKHHVRKYSSKWYRLEFKKMRRFGYKYNGRDLPKFGLPLRTLKKLRYTRLGKRMLKGYKWELKYAASLIKADTDRKDRIHKFVGKFLTEEQKALQKSILLAKKFRLLLKQRKHTSKRTVKLWYVKRFKEKVPNKTVFIQLNKDKLNQVHFLKLIHGSHYQRKDLHSITSSKFKYALAHEYLFKDKQLSLDVSSITQNKGNFKAKKLTAITKRFTKYFGSSFPSKHLQISNLTSKWKSESVKLTKLSQIELTQRIWLDKLHLTKRAKRNRHIIVYRSNKKVFVKNSKKKKYKYLIKTRSILAALSHRMLTTKGKHVMKNQRIKTTLAKVRSHINYKLKWFNYYEFKSFRWKFYKKRWYFAMSRWKRLAEFRRMLRNAWRNYRKLKKNFLFIKLLRANFNYILGIKEADMLKKWVQIRRGDNTNDTSLTADRFNQSLQLKMDGLTMFLGLAPNRLMAQEFVRFGGMRINGMVVTDVNHSLRCNDMLQIDMKVNQDIQSLFKPTHWNSVRSRLKFTQFLQVQWSTLLFMMIRWPHSYELLEESILNQRWVRFFIRYFPVRIAKYQKAKVKWYKY